MNHAFRVILLSQQDIFNEDSFRAILGYYFFEPGILCSRYFGIDVLGDTLRSQLFDWEYFDRRGFKSGDGIEGEVGV